MAFLAACVHLRNLVSRVLVTLVQRWTWVTRTLGTRLAFARLAIPFGHPTQVCTHIPILKLASTCVYLRLLASTCVSV